MLSYIKYFFETSYNFGVPFIHVTYLLIRVRLILFIAITQEIEPWIILVKLLVIGINKKGNPLLPNIAHALTNIVVPSMHQKSIETCSYRSGWWNLKNDLYSDWTIGMYSFNPTQRVTQLLTIYQNFRFLFIHPLGISYLPFQFHAQNCI